MRRVPIVALVLAFTLLAACERAGQPEENAIVLLPVAGDPTVSFSVSFRVGSQDDPAGKEGLAYLTGQMIAEAATAKNSYEDIIEKLYPLAAGYGIRVDREMTTLTGRAHRDTIEAFMELFTDAYLHPAFEQRDFERLRNDTVNYLENTLRYASDEELGKAALYRFVFEGTPYAHPPEGTVEGLRSITLADVRQFHQEHYTGANALVALGGGFDETVAKAMDATLEQLPQGKAAARRPVRARNILGREVLLVSKSGADASISFGFPIDVRRGEREFYALWIANSWLGEHRNQASHLFQVIREQRGLNYGNYSYIEAFPEGGRRTMPPVNVPRNQQIFEVWIRTLPNEHALFALRAAMRELASLVDNGLTQEQFDLTRAFLKKYVLQFAQTTSARLGYAVDDRFYGIGGEGHLATFQRMMDELTLEEVNAAIAKHLRYDRLKIAIVTGEAEELRAALAADAPTPIEYSTPKPEAIVREDEEIGRFPLRVAAKDIRETPASTIFERGI